MSTKNQKFLIYKLTCEHSGKSYIGQTGDLTKRLSNHKTSSFCRVLHAAIQKYGWKSFTSTILADELTLDQANTLEEQLIATHNTLAPQGYNLRSGGENRQHSEETKRLMSEAHKRRWLLRLPNRSPKIKLPPRPRKGRKLRPRSPEHLAKLSAAKRGAHNPNYGKPGTMLGRKRVYERGPAVPIDKVPSVS